MLFSQPHLLDSARWRGLRVGLLGGSFNPPHKGHVHISRIALQSLQLDAVWWLITPQNPLKSADELMPLPERLSLCGTILKNEPRTIACALEDDLGVNRTYETLVLLKKLYSGTDFVFVTGFDNAQTLHSWYRWQDILNLVATAHISRPPAASMVKNSPLRLLRCQNHVSMGGGKKVDLSPGNTYWLMQRPMRKESSSQIREI